MMKKKYLTPIFLLVFLGAFSQAEEKQTTLLNSYFDQAYEQTYQNKDSAYVYFEKALQLAKQLNDLPTQLDIISYTIYAADYHYDLRKLQTELSKIEKVLFAKNAAKNIEGFDDYHDAYLLDKGNYYFKTKEYEKAKTYFQQLFNTLTQQPVKLNQNQLETLYTAYTFLATIYKNTGKFDLSEEFYLNAINFVNENKSTFEDYQDYINNSNRLLAQLYSQTGQYKKANTFLSRARTTYLRHFEQDSKFKNNVISIHQKLAENCLAQDSVSKALVWLGEGKRYLAEKDPFFKEYLVLYGDAFAGSKSGENSLRQYQLALNAYTDYHKDQPHQDIAKIHGKVAAFHLKHGNFEAGLHAIAAALANTGKKIIVASPDTQIPPETVFSKRQLLHLLDIKLQLLQLGFEKTKQYGYLKSALKTNTNILQTFDLLKKEFDSKLDKQFLAETCYPIFHHMIAVAHLAYEQERNPSFIELALNISEKNKDFILLEALRSTSASRYGNVPEHILDKESQFRSEIANLETRLFDKPENHQAFSMSLFELKKEYYTFLDSIELAFPKYHQLKYGAKSLPLTEVRSTLLNEQNALLSFTVTAEHLYVITLNDTKEEFLKLPFTASDRSSVRQFYTLISTPSLAKDSQIPELGALLFEKILKKPLKGFRAAQLTIIPDGLLHYIPFDILSENDAYLLETKNIGYGNSIGSLISLKNNPGQKNAKVLAFAPRFEGTDNRNSTRQFGQLAYNDQELVKVNAFFNTASYLYEKATLKNFREQAPAFGIIHLATHASANDEFPDYSYLAFSQNEKENILYTKDLYASTINAEMVTLSACQTGIGTLRNGQGMLSLSKGFYYAGAKSLVNTLWKINDKSSVKLMEFFYESLCEGNSKQEALRAAKLKYLKNTDDPLLQHPYYWSAFVVSGDTAPITRKTWTRYAALGIMGLFAVGFMTHRLGLF